MKVTVENRNGKYFAIIQYENKVPQKILVKKSWNNSFSKEVLLNYNIVEEPLNLLENKYDLLNFEIELEPISEITDYYKLLITTQNDLTYPFYIDYNLFYNIQSSNEIYFYEIKDTKIDLTRNVEYNISLLGNFGDKHNINVERIEGRKIFFKIPDKSILNSEFYYIVFEKNGNRLLKDYLNLYIEKYSIEFIVNLEDYGEYYKCLINTKHNYKIVKSLEIDYLDKKIKIHNKYSTYLFIPKGDFKKPIEIKINASIKEDYVGAETFNKSFLIVKNLIYKKQASIDNFKAEYDPIIDTYKLNWNTCCIEEIRFKIQIGDKTVFSNSASILLDKFKQFNNEQPKIKLTIYAGVNNYFIPLYETDLENPFFKYKSNLFTPLIDYSNYVNSSGQTGTILWNKPNFKFYSAIKVERVLHKSFIHENTKPWLTNSELLLEKNFNNIVSGIDNLENIIYDFNQDEIKIGKSKDSVISYIKNNGFIFIGETNKLEIPKWFIHKDEKIKITVKIYDYWLKEQGEHSVEFSMNYKSYQLLDTDIRINRNQEIQFGETGTVGEYDSLKNVGPVEVYKFYSPENKTYLEEPKTNYSNTDFNNKSLYFYFNSNGTKTVDFKFNRSSNHKELEIKILKNNNVIYETVFKFLGNNFNDNIFKLRRSLLSEEGVYEMQLTTINPYGVKSETKILNFYVFNDKPEAPIIQIPENQHIIKDGKFIINRKYFSLSVINNSRSEKYAGWKYKEVHFFFKTNRIDDSFNTYPDYVIQASKEDGSIHLINKTSFANGEYKCKVVPYDYSGNAGVAYEFDFEIKNSIYITPEKLLTNDLENPFIWNIKKAEDSEGFYYYVSYSPDNIQPYVDETPIKVESPYFIGNTEHKSTYNLSTNWLKELGKWKLGFYKLTVYEWNYNYPNGVDEKFESPIVEVNKTGNPSNPIYAKEIEGVKVFNNRKSNEYVYTKDLNLLEFTTIHDETLLETDLTKTDENLIIGKFYKIQLIPPSKNQNYIARLPIPESVGQYTFNKIAERCNVQNQEEGVWELRFITIDKYKNNNETNGYYSYKIVLVKGNPVINQVTPTNNNGSDYFSVNSENIGFIVETSSSGNIIGISENESLFNINKVKVKFLSTPNNLQYEIIKDKDTNNFIQIMNNLTKENKIKHDLDGRYIVSFTAIDFLGRESSPYEKTFYIDTKMDFEVSFLNENNFIEKNVSLYANVSSNIKKIYYKFLNNIDEVNTIRTNNLDLIEQSVTSLIYNSSNIFGFKLEHTFDSLGYKYLAYWVEEQSGNISDIKFYKFNIINPAKLIPVFDYSNKVLYTNSDKEINITWHSSHQDIKTFEIKMEKVAYDNDGDYHPTELFMLEVNNNRFIPVGSATNPFVNIGSKRNINIEFNEHSIFGSGIYKFTVRGENLYGTKEENYFIFQILNTKFVNLRDELLNNKITIQSNKVSWKYVADAESYDVSYDGKTFINTKNNYFFLDRDKIVTDNNGHSFIYIRYRNLIGIPSELEKIPVILNLVKLKKPIIECETVSLNNNKIEFTVKVEEPDLAKYIYYSFDKKQWFSKEITGYENKINNHLLTYPVKDGTYNLFALTTDENPLTSDNFNKSEISHNYITIFAKEIEKPKLNIKHGEVINQPTNLYIINKMKDVDYFIYINGKKVNEGHEISSSNLQIFNITVSARKKGRNEIVELIKNGEFSISVFTGNYFLMNIGSDKIVCNINSLDETIEIVNMDNLRNKEVVLYKEKNTDNWKTLLINDKLNLNLEYEFKIINFKIDN